MEVRSLIIDGAQKRSGSHNRYRIYVNNQPLFLQGSTFRYLVRLALDRGASDLGGTPLEEFNDNHLLVRRYVWLLRQQVPFSISRPLAGVYAIDVDPAVIRFNWKRLAMFDDCRISGPFRQEGVRV